MINKKKQIYALFFFSQFLFFPFFLNFNISAKFFFITLAICIFLVFYRIEEYNRLSLLLILISSTLVSLTCFYSYNPISSIISGGILLSLLLFTFLVFPTVFRRGFDLSFFSLFLFFIQIVTVLGLYQYFSFIAVGKSKNPLIPYLIPPNLGGRVSGIYGQPNLFALLLVVGVIGFIYFYLHGRKIFKSNTPFFQKFYYVPLISVSLCFFLTQSRSGLIAFLLSIFILILYFYKRGSFSRGSAFRPLLLNIFFSLIGSYCLFVVFDTVVSGMPDRTFTDVGMSADARFIFWTASLLMFLDYPAFGIGLDNFKFLLPKYTNAAHDLLGFVEYEAMGYTKWSHNELLQLLCETGLLGVAVAGLLILYLINFLAIIRNGSHVSMRIFFAYLLILPFVIQSMFSWPLRHPSLLVLFFIFIGSLVSLSKWDKKPLARWASVSFKIIAVFGFCVISIIGYHEIKMGRLFDSYSKENLRESYSDFQVLVKNPYLEHTLLLESIPSYVSLASQEKDVEFGKKILPYAERLVDLHGSHWQWFNLALLYLTLDRMEDAMNAVNKAINLRPMEQKYWSFQHYLNMIRASEQTGRPLEDFLPIPPGGTADDVKGLFNFDDRIKFNK